MAPSAPWSGTGWQRHRARTRSRRATLPLWFGLLLFVAGNAQAAGNADLDAAFLASFGRSAPFDRTARSTAVDDPADTRPLSERTALYTVRPRLLVHLAGRRYALVSFETNRQGWHSEGGWIAVSYLDRNKTGWTLRRLWPELLYTGVGGEPANAGDEVHVFGSDPLFLARSAWCGMNECSEWLGTIRLSPDAPVAFDDVLAGAVSPYDASDDLMSAGVGCQNYSVTAVVKPPRRRDALFSVRYDGWTSAPGTLSPKSPLHLSTSYVPDGTKLRMQPKVPVPVCGR